MNWMTALRQGINALPPEERAAHYRAQRHGFTVPGGIAGTCFVASALAATSGSPFWAIPATFFALVSWHAVAQRRFTATLWARDSRLYSTSKTLIMAFQPPFRQLTGAWAVRTEKRLAAVFFVGVALAGIAALVITQAGGGT